MIRCNQYAAYYFIQYCVLTVECLNVSSFPQHSSSCVAGGCKQSNTYACHLPVVAGAAADGIGVAAPVTAETLGILLGAQLSLRA